MWGTLVCSYLIYEFSIRYLKIKKLKSNIHRKNAQLNNTDNQSLGLNPCKILNICVISIKQKASSSLLCTEYSSIAIVTRN